MVLTRILMPLLATAMALLTAAFSAKTARLAGFSSSAARRLGLVVAAGLAGWLALTATLAASGALSMWTSLPPRLPILPLSAFGAIVVLVRTSAAKAMIPSMPRHWPIAAQTFRIGVELALFGLYTAGEAPRQVTFEGRNLDILVGITAPVVALLVARKRVSPPAAALWNVIGLAVLANTIGTVITSAPGPLHAAWPGQPFTALATWPLVWLPSFLAPLAVFFHVVSLRQATS